VNRVPKPTEEETKLDNWVCVVIVTDRLCGVQKSRVPEIHPTVLLEQAIQHVYLGRGPSEQYSSARPALNPHTPDDDLLIPIDEVLANYDDRQRCIIIYIYNVRATATRLNCSEEELLYVVRVRTRDGSFGYLVR
jgi:hypothetical protein